MVPKFFMFLFFIGIINLSAQTEINRFDANGDRTGKWEKKYTNGRIRYTGQFVNGKEVGKFYFYSEFNENHPYLVKNFVSGTNYAKVQFFSRNGILESEGKMVGKHKKGKWLFYGANGKTILVEENYLNGKLHGVSKIFYKDGTLTEESFYRNGVLHGTTKRYTDKGKMITNIPYVDGKIHGKVFYYDNEGVIRETGYYDMDKRVGRWEFYIDGELVGVDEPNKKVEKPSYSLEEIQRRKEAKNPKKNIPKKVFTLAEIEERKNKNNPIQKTIPKKTFSLEEIQERKEKRIPKKKIYKKDTLSIEELQKRKSKNKN
ncbi:toxin-antitoxin system YwqK family antitoxin [Bacteroidota bacterium]